MSLRQPPVPRTRRSARGAISVMAALLIATVAIAALVSIDVGHVFMRQRQLQNMVDLAAMSAAQQLKRASSASKRNEAVLATVKNIGPKNGYSSSVDMGCATASGGGADMMTACLGWWDPMNGSDPRHFSATTDDTKLNAVRVQATQTVPILFVIPGGRGRQLFAEAIVTGSPPVAAFSLGSGLLNVETANSVFSKLLGNAVDLSTGWNGLVNAKLTVDQLRLMVGAGSVQELLAVDLSLRDFYTKVLRAAGQDQTLSLLQPLVPETLGVKNVAAVVPIGQVLNLWLSTPVQSSAAEAEIDVLQLLAAATQVANGNAAVATGVTTSKLPLGLGEVQTSLSIVQPPVTAVGPARKNTEGSWQTSVNTAQVDLMVRAGLSISAVAGLADVKLNLPLYVNVAAATANLTALQCAADRASRRATFEVTSSLVKACLTEKCQGGTVSIGKAAAVGIPLLDLSVQEDAAARVAGERPQELELEAGKPVTVHASAPITGVLAQVNALKVIPKVGPVQVLPALDLGVLLAPVGNLIDTPVVSLLNSLGIQLGNADLLLHSIDCNNAELVY